MVLVYHETAQIQWTTKKPHFDRGESSWIAEQRNLGGLDGRTVMDEYAGQGMNRLGVRNEEKEEKDEEGTSSERSSDFEVIV